MGKVTAVAKPVSKCDFCGAGFKKLEHLQRHRRTHTLDRPYVCPATECGKAFARQDTLTRHYRLHTRENEPSKRKESPLILHTSRRRTKSAPDMSPQPMPMRRERARMATESYLPSPAPSLEVAASPCDPITAWEPLQADEPEEEEIELPPPQQPRRPSRLIDTNELFRAYATPESIVSPLPFTADSATFDLGDYASSMSEETPSLASLEDDAPSFTNVDIGYEPYFAAFQPAPVDFEQEHWVPLNALRMSMGEAATAEYKVPYFPGESYLAP